jgi:hypothetical protein
MYNNRETNRTYGQSERNRRLAIEAQGKRNLILGLIMAPIYLLGWFPVVWIVSKVLGK